MSSQRPFADNWTWLSPRRFQHARAVARLTELTGSLRLQIDWSKAYFWAVDAPTRRWWKQSAHTMLPLQVEVQRRAPCVKELGIHLQFDKRRHLGHTVDRFAEATARLHRLFHLPSSLATEAHVIQSGIWPFLFHGAFGIVPGRHRLNVLRGNAAGALIGRHHALSSMATFGLMPGVMDPELYLLLRQVMQLRRSFDVAPQVAEQVLAQASSGKQPALPCFAVFTDGAAHHSSIPPARLTYWSVVLAGHSLSSGLFKGWDLLDAVTRASRFQVLCQGSTPARQTVARPELAAVAGVCRRAKQERNIRVDFYADCQ